jgi:hypothetical protein
MPRAAFSPGGVGGESMPDESQQDKSRRVKLLQHVMEMKREAGVTGGQVTMRDAWTLLNYGTLMEIVDNCKVGSLTWDKPIIYRRSELDRLMQKAVMNALLSGDLEAVGFDLARSGSSKAVPIPPDRWRAMRPDFEKSEALDGDRTLFSGVLVSRAAAKRRPAPVGRQKASLLQAYAAQFEGEPAPSRDEYRAWAKTSGITQREIEAFVSREHPEWKLGQGAPGQRRKPLG